MYIFLSLLSAKREKVPKREKQTRGLRPDAPWTPTKLGSTAIFTQLKSNGIRGGSNYEFSRRCVGD